MDSKVAILLEIKQTNKNLSLILNAEIDALRGLSASQRHMGNKAELAVLGFEPPFPFSCFFFFPEASYKL